MAKKPETRMILEVGDTVPVSGNYMLVGAVDSPIVIYLHEGHKAPPTPKRGQVWQLSANGIKN